MVRLMWQGYPVCNWPQLDICQPHCCQLLIELILVWENYVNSTHTQINWSQHVFPIPLFFWNTEHGFFNSQLLIPNGHLLTCPERDPDFINRCCSSDCAGKKWTNKSFCIYQVCSGTHCLHSLSPSTQVLYVTKVIEMEGLQPETELQTHSSPVWQSLASLSSAGGDWLTHIFSSGLTVAVHARWWDRSVLQTQTLDTTAVDTSSCTYFLYTLNCCLYTKEYYLRLLALWFLRPKRSKQKNPLYTEVI